MKNEEWTEDVQKQVLQYWVGNFTMFKGVLCNFKGMADVWWVPNLFSAVPVVRSVKIRFVLFISFFSIFTFAWTFLNWETYTLGLFVCFQSSIFFNFNFWLQFWLIDLKDLYYLRISYLNYLGIKTEFIK